MTDPFAWMAEQLDRNNLPGDGRPDAPVGRAALAVRNAVISTWRTRADIAEITCAAQSTIAIELRRMEQAGEVAVERGSGKRPDRYRRVR